MIPLARSLALAAVLCAFTGVAQASEPPSPQLAPPSLTLDRGGGDGFASGGGQGSFLSGRTLGAGNQGILAQFGWPGISFEYLYGNSSKLDLGGTFTFNYGFDGRTVIDPGLKMQFDLRLNLLDKGKVNLGLRFDPGISMYFGSNNHNYYNDFLFGFTVPVALVLGISAGDAIMINLGMDMPMTIYVTNGGFFELPILFGPGIEYHVDSHLSIDLDARFGPSIFINNRGSYTDFAFRTLVGISYKF